MPHAVSVREQAGSGTAGCAAPPPNRRFLGAGLGSGLLGGVCCFGSALAIGASIGGLSFFSTWMERYQIYFVLASALVMALWLVRQAHRARTGGGSTVRAFLRGARRQLVVMGAGYLITLGLAMAVVAAVRHM
jgi:hypothetical protein